MQATRVPAHDATTALTQVLHTSYIAVWHPAADVDDGEENEK